MLPVIIIAAGIAIAAPAPQQATADADPLLHADTNGDGVLSHAEVIAEAQAGGGDTSRSVTIAEAMFKWADRNHDGSLDAKERHSIYARQKANARPRPVPGQQRDRLLDAPVPAE